MAKAIFLDRDGTINVEKDYLYKIEDFEFLPGVIEGLKKLQEAGFILIIITNQSGIGRGYYTEEDFNILTEWMRAVLQKEGIDISEIRYCPHLPDATVEKYRMVCKCRKPGIEMFLAAINKFSIDLEKSYAIGDKIRDLAICESSECRGFLVGTNEQESVIETVKKGVVPRVRYGFNFKECVDEILKEGN